MPTIIKKGTNPSAFRLKSGKTIIINVERGGGDILNFVSEGDFKALMYEYGSFIAPRIISDKNPDGCFIVSADRAMAHDMAAEIGEEIKDNSAPIQLEQKSIETKPLEILLEQNPTDEDMAAEIGEENSVEEKPEQIQEVEEKSKKGKK